MTNDFLQCAAWIFQSAWRFLTGIYLPGTNVTPAAMLLFGALTFIVFNWLSALLNTSAPSKEEKDHSSRSSKKGSKQNAE